MSNVKEKIKAVTSMRLFLPIVCLIAVLLVNLITTPGFFKISINNGVLYGYDCRYCKPSFRAWLYWRWLEHWLQRLPGGRILA